MSINCHYPPSLPKFFEHKARYEPGENSNAPNPLPSATAEEIVNVLAPPKLCSIPVTFPASKLPKGNQVFPVLPLTTALPLFKTLPFWYKYKFPLSTSKAKPTMSFAEKVPKEDVALPSL